jgi:hypothetical protein
VTRRRNGRSATQDRPETIAFTGLGILAGIVAGFASKKAFDRLWGPVDDPKHREIDLLKVLAALAIEGAIARLVRGLAEHGARHGYARVTGNWPGEERPAA